MHGAHCGAQLYEFAEFVHNHQVSAAASKGPVYHRNRHRADAAGSSTAARALVLATMGQGSVISNASLSRRFPSPTYALKAILGSRGRWSSRSSVESLLLPQCWRDHGVCSKRGKTGHADSEDATRVTCSPSFYIGGSDVGLTRAVASSVKSDTWNHLYVPAGFRTQGLVA